jgi:hypothetical protein
MGLKYNWPADNQLTTFKTSNIFHSSLFSCISIQIKSSYLMASALMFNPLLFTYKLIHLIIRQLLKNVIKFWALMFIAS